MRLSIENFIFLKIEGMNGILFGGLTLPSPKEWVLKADLFGRPSGLSAHTPAGIMHGPVSASIPGAKIHH